MIPGPHRLSTENIRQAVKSIDPVFLNTPQFISDSLSDLFNLRLVVKIETLNPIRCFKGRGADLLVNKAAEKRPLVCASAGNFGQAMAYSCKKKGIPLTIFASRLANTFKLERMSSLGAQVIQFGEDFDGAKTEARKWASQTGKRFVEDSLDIETLEGAGTIGIELLDLAYKLDTILIPLGNGALFNGIARMVKQQSPSTRLVAVQSSGASAMVDSWRTGRMVTYDKVQTIADGIAVRIPVPQALKDMKGLVDDAILVPDQTILDSMKLIHQHLGITVEPSAVVGIAAILENPGMFQKQTVATIITGGNLTEIQVKNWLMK
jgi:threonine dehydratase